MSELVLVESDFLTCSMCYEIFQEPKILSCLHRFCERCLHSWITGSHTCNQRGREGFPCPVCREFIEVSDSIRPPSEWASLLKTDFYVNSLISFVEARRRLAQNQHVPDPQHPCQTHADKDCDLYCADCSKIICYLCAGVSHRMCNKVLTLNDAAGERKAAMELKLHDANKKLGEASELNRKFEICMSHLKLRKRDAETEIRKWGQNMHRFITTEENKLLDQLRNGFAVRQGEVASKINQFKAKLLKNKETFQIITSKVSTGSSFDLMCDNSVLEMLKEIEDGDIIILNGYKEFANKLSDLRISVETNPESIIMMAQIVFSNKESNSSSSADSFSGILQPVHPMKSSSQKRQTHSSEGTVCAKAAPETQTATPKCLPDAAKRRQVLLSQEVSNSACEVSNSLLNNPAHVNRSQTGAQEKTKSPLLSVALGKDELNSQQSRRTEALEPFQHLKTIDTRVQEDDSYCDLRDLIVVCPGNLIVVTDWANQCVKAFDSRREKHARLVLGGKPWAITQMTEELAAVSLPLSHEICIVEISSLVWSQETFVTSKSYFGLAAFSRTLLVASSVRDTPCVDIINLNGEVLKSFAHDNTGANMFAYPAYISLTSDRQILVSDEHMGALICLSQSGETKFIYKPEDRYQFHEARGVTAHISGRIIVAKSQGLLSLTESGQFDNLLVKPQKKILLHPRGVDHDTSGLVYVTDKGQVLIFQYYTNITDEGQ